MTDYTNWKDISVNYSKEAEEAVTKRMNELAKPVGGLGQLETIVKKIAGLTGDANYDIDKRAVAVFCADNGVVKKGVTQAGSEVTAILANLLTTGNATVCHMAKIAKADVVAVDMGMITEMDIPGLANCRISAGTEDISEGPAMSREQAIQAINYGIDVVRDLKEKGYKLIATGEMGIGNTTTSSAVAAVVLGLSPSLTTGRGTGISDEVLAQKIGIVEKAIEVNNPDPSDALDVISKVGGFDIAGMVGAYIGGAMYNIPILVDGVISAAAALCAANLCPASKQAMIATQVTIEPASKMILDALGLKPIVSAEFHLGEGGGAVATMPILEMAYGIYKDMVTLAEINIVSYKPTVEEE